jgi:hypothetical protein
MSPPVFDNFLFDLLSQLTGGLVTDIKTMLAAMVVIGFTAMGADVLIEKLGGKLKQHKESMIFAQNVFDSSKSFSAARSYRSLRDTSEEGSFDYDYYNSLYRAKLNESVSLSVKTGEPMSSGASLFDDGGHDTHFDSLMDQPSSEKPAVSWNSASLSGSGYVGFHSDDPGPTEFDRSHDDEDY